MTDQEPTPEIKSALVSKRQYHAAPLVTLIQHISGECDLPYKYPSFGGKVMIGRGFDGTANAVRLVIIADTPEKRVAQLREHDMPCNACNDLLPEHEMIVGIKRNDGTPVKAIVYICGKCKEIAKHGDGDIRVDITRTIEDLPNKLKLVKRRARKLNRSAKDRRLIVAQKTKKAERKRGRRSNGR